MRLIDASKYDLKGAEITWLEQRDYAITAHKEKIYKIPTVDAAPVKHGRWLPSEKYAGYNACSNCGDCYIDPEWAMNGKWHYCPHCGAKMDGAEEDEHGTV